MILEPRPLGLAIDPIHVAVHQRLHARLGGLRLGEIAVAQSGLIIQRGEKQRGHQTFLVAEVVVDGADAGIAFGANHLDGRGLDALLVEQFEGLAKDVALEFGAPAGIAAFE
ncbi:hypothetical protein D3C85_1461150 [compost metagenome]